MNKTISAEILQHKIECEAAAVCNAGESVDDVFLVGLHAQSFHHVLAVRRHAAQADLQPGQGQGHGNRGRHDKVSNSMIFALMWVITVAYYVHFYTAGSRCLSFIFICDAKNCTIIFIFAIALSELHLLRQLLAYIYLRKFPIILVFNILYITRDGEPG